ncbi:asparagine synthase (glutamine-hydrolyzing) [Sphingomonas sp. KR1UV-12]|uniref:asparagine synthase (glutamine-hydrolyzing) n=1 Tax=Sphingomonas aurea TaxID=3063994 RepID=A0ABT9EPB7_9SPHN|nr:asparagine synthase (glutamine-hydrolyzing) [Sphingomonas sp. KR1UV-12]MDP1028812.1 asparagine synthase (glutamine-hydrolyzing) [Sphingomonas sp. KR1UV-12]
MCGIAGFMASGGSGDDLLAQLRAMTGSIEHRGPDDAGYWVDKHLGIGLGHRRLSIVDLSPSGHQPMTSASGRYVIVYNGEIYNHRQLRRHVEAGKASPDWKGHSDTEVLLACLDAWGLERTLARINGMFAFALWDVKAQTLTLARDRLGEKPLYYGQQGNRIFFASELKAIIAHPSFRRTINRQAAARFMQLGYVPAPLSIWRDVSKLPPAHILTIAAHDRSLAAPRCYWDLDRIAAEGVASPLADTPALVDELDGLLRDAVALRMEADVPLGAFLSGGVDSSAVTALMQAQSSRPIKTFSIGFTERSYDESEHAKAVARHLSTDHHMLRVTPAEIQDVLPRLPQIWDEPFADASQLPTFLVNAFARKEVTVALSGDGGDELFAGYNRHVLGSRIWHGSERMPRLLRRGVAALLTAPSLTRAATGIAQLSRAGAGVADLAERLGKVGAVIAAEEPADFYERLVSKWPSDHGLVLGAPSNDAGRRNVRFMDFRNTMLFMDTATYLPDDILVKVDRAGMSVSLEGRIPFLDHRVVELAWRIPLSAKIRDNRGKHILREVLYRYVPASLIDRPKAGFGVPIGAWLLGPLRSWADHLLDPVRMHAEGYLDPKLAQASWKAFQQGDRARLPQIWCMLMFQAWLEHQHGIAHHPETVGLAA